MKYYIVAKTNEIEVDGNSAEDAICNFAATMESDMNTYFTAMSEEEYEKYRYKADADASKRHIIRFMRNELVNTFHVPEDDAEEVACDAFSIYEEGNGETEYECIEKAFENWKTA